MKLSGCPTKGQFTVKNALLPLLEVKWPFVSQFYLLSHFNALPSLALFPPMILVVARFLRLLQTSIDLILCLYLNFFSTLLDFLSFIETETKKDDQFSKQTSIC